MRLRLRTRIMYAVATKSEMNASATSIVRLQKASGVARTTA